MGTLGNQPWRSERIDGYVMTVLTMANMIFPGAKDRELTCEELQTAAKVVLAASSLQDGDYRDEQMGGLGEILSQIAENVRSDHPLMTGEAIQDLAEAVRERS